MKFYLKLFRFLLLTVFSGLLAGAASAVFLGTLERISLFRDSHPWLLFFLPATAVLTALIYRRFGQGSVRGNNLLIDSVHHNIDVPPQMAGLVFLFTLLSHLTGASVGRESTAVQIGGSISHQVGRLFRLDRIEVQILTMAGISAGFGSVFGAPMAGAFFGLEMLFIGKLSYSGLLPCFIASYTANTFATALGATHAVRLIKQVPALTPYTLIIILVAALIFGLIGRLFAWSVHALKAYYARLLPQTELRALVASLVVVLIVVICNGYRYGGLSVWMIDQAMLGLSKIWDPLLKLLLTIVSVGAGLQGGEATPLFAIGSSLGSLIGLASGIEPSLLAALGLISVFGAAANVPVTTIILGLELFGLDAAPYYVLSALISYYVTGHHGIYSAQKIQTPKRPPVDLN